MHCPRLDVYVGTCDLVLFLLKKTTQTALMVVLFFNLCKSCNFYSRFIFNKPVIYSGTHQQKILNIHCNRHLTGLLIWHSVSLKGDAGFETFASYRSSLRYS